MLCKYMRDVYVRCVAPVLAHGQSRKRPENKSRAESSLHQMLTLADKTTAIAVGPPVLGKRYYHPVHFLVHLRVTG
jgi:hypothetical protein